MNKTLCLFTALIVFAVLSPVMAGEKSFPAKNPVLKFQVPGDWKAGTNAQDGSFAMESPEGRVAIHFATIPNEASLKEFEKILPDLLKKVKDATIVDKAKEFSEAGLTRYTATYAAKIDDKPAICIFALFKGDKEQSVIGTIFVGQPETQESIEACSAFMASMKGAK